MSDSCLPVNVTFFSLFFWSVAQQIFTCTASLLCSSFSSLCLSSGRERESERKVVKQKVLPAPCCMCCYCGSAVDAVFPPRREREREREWKIGKQGNRRREGERKREGEGGGGGQGVQYSDPGERDEITTRRRGGERRWQLGRWREVKKKRRPHKEKRRDKQESQECRVSVEHCAELLKADWEAQKQTPCSVSHSLTVNTVLWIPTATKTSIPSLSCLSCFPDLSFSLSLSPLCVAHVCVPLFFFSFGTLCTWFTVHGAALASLL